MNRSANTTPANIESLFNDPKSRMYQNMSGQDEYAGLKTIEDMPKEVKKPIFTPMGKKVIIISALLFFGYVMYRRSKSNNTDQQPQVPSNSQPPMGEQGSPTNSDVSNQNPTQ